MKRLLVLIIGILALAGCAQNSEQKETENEIEPLENAKVVKIQSIGKKEMVGRSSLPGDIKADDIQVVSSVVAGTLEDVKISVGQPVKKGQILAKLDDELLHLQKEQARIASQLGHVRLEAAKRSHERIKMLYEKGSVTKSDFEGASDALLTAKLNYSSGNNREKQINYQLKHMKILAPIDGTVAKVYQKSGGAVAPGTPICEVVNTKDVIVESGVTESQINSIKPDQNVKIDVPAVGKTFSGKVEGIGPVPGQDRNYPVRIRIDNSEGKLRPGMFSELTVDTGKALKVLSLPKVAVISEDGQNYVFLMKADKKVSRKVIELGASFGDYFEVQKGIESGDKVVVSGQDYLADGDIVRIVD